MSLSTKEDIEPSSLNTILDFLRTHNFPDAEAALLNEFQGRSTAHSSSVIPAHCDVPSNTNGAKPGSASVIEQPKPTEQGLDSHVATTEIPQEPPQANSTEDLGKESQNQESELDTETSFGKMSEDGPLFVPDKYIEGSYNEDPTSQKAVSKVLNVSETVPTTSVADSGIDKQKKDLPDKPQLSREPDDKDTSVNSSRLVVASEVKKVGEPSGSGDEYEDEDDPGYIRHEVLNPEVFLAGLNFDSDDEVEVSELSDPIRSPAVEFDFTKDKQTVPAKPEAESKGEVEATPQAKQADRGTDLGGEVGGFSFPSLDSPGTETDGHLSDSAVETVARYGSGSEKSPPSQPKTGFSWEQNFNRNEESPLALSDKKKVQDIPVQSEEEDTDEENINSEDETSSEMDNLLEAGGDDGAEKEAFETFELKIIHRKGRTGFEESKDFPVRMNDIVAGRYQVMEFLGSAAFSKAIQALDLQTGMLVCIKIIKNNKDFFDQSLDEIKLLKYINSHDPADAKQVLRLYDFFYFKEHLFIVCELLRANLYEFQKYNRESGEEPYFTTGRLRSIARQVLTSLEYLHSLNLIHCDLKPENILIKSYSRCLVKIIDLGSSCFITDHLSSYVQSRSYRAPEVILGAPYGQKIDIWSVGCILAELFSGFVLFQNDSLSTLLARVIGILCADTGTLPPALLARSQLQHKYFNRQGMLYEQTPDGDTFALTPKKCSLTHRLPGADPGFIEFVRVLLAVDPNQRPTATQALAHPWLKADED